MAQPAPAKPDRYSAKEAVDELEALSEKLAADLRRQIRGMANFPILSDQWNEMADVLGRVAHVSDMEAKLPSPKNEATLWETEELALRYLLEDGKLNLSLRNMIEFKHYMRRLLRNGDVPSADHAQKFDKFEKGMGVVLRNAWNHVEALQTTDLPALVNHIGDVLQTAVDNGDYLEPLIKSDDLAQRQEIFVFHYLATLMRYIDDIHEDRIMPIVRERNIFMNAVIILTTYHSSMSEVDSMKALEALSGLASTEDFSTYRREYVRREEDADVLIELRSSVLGQYQDDFKARRIVRPLLDVVLNVSRQFNMK